MEKGNENTPGKYVSEARVTIKLDDNVMELLGVIDTVSAGLQRLKDIVTRDMKVSFDQNEVNA